MISPSPRSAAPSERSRARSLRRAAIATTSASARLTVLLLGSRLEHVLGSRESVLVHIDQRLHGPSRVSKLASKVYPARVEETPPAVAVASHGGMQASTKTTPSGNGSRRSAISGRRKPAPLVTVPGSPVGHTARRSGTARRARPTPAPARTGRHHAGPRTGLWRARTASPSPCLTTYSTRVGGDADETVGVAEVVVLGSGSPVPDPERGGATLAVVADDGWMMVDCGRAANRTPLLPAWI